MERQKFEENWKSAFDGAETTPPDRVWSSIELDLAGQESAAMKKRVVFYQRLAAAFLLFSLGTGIYAFYPRTEQQNIVQQNIEPQKELKNDKGTNGVAKSTEIVKDPVVSDVRPSVQTDFVKEKEEQPLIALEVTAPVVIEDEQQPIVADISEEENKEETRGETKAETKEEKKETLAVVSPLLQDTNEPDEIVQPKRKRTRENNLWLALGAAAGNYAPNTPSAITSSGQNQFLAGPSIQAASQPTEAKVGTAYSFGMAVGKKFGRIVVQTGVNLGKQQVNYSSSYDARTASNSAKAASSDYLAAESNSAQLSVTNPYTVNSSMEIVSIPVQAGYMIIDRRLGWQFNAGVSPDFFIRNILVDESGQRERFTQSAGSASPYRSVNWSGLLNTELSYRIGSHYRLSLVPGVRYSFNSILKEPTDNGRPVIFDVGFRFRYLFE